MITYLLNSINNNISNSASSSALLIYIYDNKITTLTQLVDRLAQEYFDLNPSYGYLYCIYHYSYKIYGNNVYKLGQAVNIKHRIASYTTYYIDPVELKYSSSLINFYTISEIVLFKRLDGYRIKQNREFFNCEFDIIKQIIDDIIIEFNTNKIMDIVKKYKITVKSIMDIQNKIITYINNFGFTTIVTYDIMNKKKYNGTKTRNNIEYTLTNLRDVFCSPLIENTTYTTLLNRQNSTVLTKEESSQVTHFFLNKKYKLSENVNKDILIDFFVEYGQKLDRQLQNFYFLFNPDKQIHDKNIQILESKHTDKLNWIIKILNKIGFNNFFDTNIIVSKNIKEFSLTVVELEELRSAFCGMRDLTRVRAKEPSSHIFINHFSKILNYMFGIKIKSKGIDRTKDESRTHIYEYRIECKNYMLDYIVLFHKQNSNNKTVGLFDQFKQFLENKKFTFTGIHGYSGYYTDFIKNDNQVHMIMSKN